MSIYGYSVNSKGFFLAVDQVHRAAAADDLAGVHKARLSLAYAKSFMDQGAALRDKYFQDETQSQRQAAGKFSQLMFAKA